MHARPVVVALALTLALTSRAAGPELALPSLTSAQLQQRDSEIAAARRAMDAGDLAQAARRYERALKIHAGNEGDWYNLACVQARMGRPTLALQSLDRALEAGWRDAEWPARDPDLKSLRAEDLGAWLERVKAARDDGDAEPGAPASTSEEIDALATAAQDRVDAVSSALGAAESRRAAESIARWKAASWDAVATEAKDDAARESAEWSALQALLNKRLEPRLPGVRAEAARRADAFAAAHPASEHASAARFAAATARMRLASAGATKDELSSKVMPAYERELLLIAATSTAGEGLERALAALVAQNEDDLDTARRFHSRLRSVVGDERRFRDLMTSAARGLEYRLDGIPEFEAKTLDGRTVTRASLLGRVTLIDFWATWCGPCKDELPHVKDAYAKFKDRGFEIIGMSLDVAKDGDPKAFQVWCSEHGVTWPQVFDGKHWDAEMAKLFGVKAIPFPILVGRDGRVAFADEELRGEALVERVESLLDAPAGM